MSEKTPLDWALLAVAAATIKASEVTVAVNPVESDLPAFAVGDTLVYQANLIGHPNSPDGHCWATGDLDYNTLAEALAEAVSQEVYRRVEKELGQAGLAT